jgi:hypothetical protein
MISPPRAQTVTRTAIMIRRDSAFAGTYVIGEEAALILAAISGISDVRIESQFVDRANLSFVWDNARTNFTFRPDFQQLDRMLQTKGMHRMQ